MLNFHDLKWQPKWHDHWRIEKKRNKTNLIFCRTKKLVKPWCEPLIDLGFKLVTWAPDLHLELRTWILDRVSFRGTAGKCSENKSCPLWKWSHYSFAPYTRTVCTCVTCSKWIAVYVPWQKEERREKELNCDMEEQRMKDKAWKQQ